MNGRRTLCAAAVLLSLVTCQRELGESPVGEPVGPESGGGDTLIVGDSVTEYLRISASPSVLAASSDDSAVVTVRAFDASHNPLSGKEVRFLASSGTITTLDTTDNAGSATATFRAVPRNQEVKIVARLKWGNRTYSAGRTLSVSGLTVAVRPTVSDTLAGVVVPVRVTVTDGKGKPVPDAVVRMSGLRDTAGTTKGDGSILTSATASSETVVSLKAWALGDTGSATVQFWRAIPQDSVSANLRVTVSPSLLRASTSDAATVRATAVDANNNPVAGRAVRFTTTHGTITMLDTTDGNGVATATLTSVQQNAEARVVARMTVADSAVAVSYRVLISGVHASIEPAQREALAGSAVPVRIRVTDGRDEAVNEALLDLAGLSDKSGSTRGDGILSTTATSPTEGAVALRAVVQGDTARDTIRFWKKSDADTVRGVIEAYVKPAALNASVFDSAQVVAQVSDSSHNPIPGVLVRFSTTLGTVTASARTDAAGRAAGVLRGAALNADGKLTAWFASRDGVVSTTQSYSLSGLTVRIVPEVQEALAGTPVALVVSVTDGKGFPVSGAAVKLTGASVSTGETRGDGRLVASVTGSAAGAAVVTAAALGDTDRVTVKFVGSFPKDTVTGSLRMYVIPSALTASNTDSAVVSVYVYDENHNPIGGREVRFAATHGTITARDSTDVAGKASATFRSVPVNAEAVVTATAMLGDSLATVSRIVPIEGLVVRIAPTVTQTVVNSVVPVTVSVTDGRGKPVPGIEVRLSGAEQTSATTKGDGTLTTSVKSATEKTVELTASALGSTDRVSVKFWTSLPDGNQQVEERLAMRIYSSRTQLRADNTDFAVITVVLTNEENNPAVGELVRFSTNLGIITETARVDSSGRAIATLRSSPVNGVCRVDAVASNRNLRASTDILFSGVKVELTADARDARTGDLVAVHALVKDGSGNGIGGDQITFFVTGAAGVFANDSGMYRATLDPNGKASATVRSATAGEVRVRAQALNTGDSVAVRFTTSTVSLAASPASIPVGGTATATITATYVDGSGAPVSGDTIVFVTNAGTLSSAKAVTNASGRAVVVLSSAAFAGTATVQAKAANGSAQTTVRFTAATATRLVLAITPDNIGVNGGVAELVATVTDANGNTVSDLPVNFRLLKGPGGGEYIDKPSVTSNNGVARCRLFAGSLPSQYRAAEVVAVAGNLADSSKLTISGEPYVITISVPEADTVIVAAGGQRDQTTFAFNVGAVVQDINGNPVADNTQVHFSAVVSGMSVAMYKFDGWTGVGTSDESRKPILTYVGLDVPFEDVNNNDTMDPNVDLRLDYNDAVARRGDDVNGDGVCDYDPLTHDFFWDFNLNGACDPGMGEPYIWVVDKGDTVMVYADLNQNGVRDASELAVDRNGNGVYNGPASGDFRYSLWEMRPYWRSQRFDFDQNDFAVAIDASAATRDGVAYAQIVYPRQMARRLYVTVNAEANGIRDKDGERFVLPVIR